MGALAATPGTLNRVRDGSVPAATTNPSEVESATDEPSTAHAQTASTSAKCCLQKHSIELVNVWRRIT